ncbi:membrane-associated HD superfamily phosphohydrolase [Fontibacillus solani]|uniref:Membrane-associated HD superfamily phosphohydrolase n=1 Tax=Fontibacillus solani TaxID=1572857 RepID=A0A7W3XSF7_9BACL|nr:hypothetical protein [Fontibacillus solani]MBA9086509.1 membrane-associated HD superfamily phosphohydrolase [Fontibacillus solani]
MWWVLVQNDDISTEYVEKMKKVYTPDISVLNSLEWLLIMVGAAGTIASTAVFVYWIYKLLMFIFAVSKGSRRWNDKRFWSYMGVSLLLIILFISGGIFLIISNLFDFL